MMDAPDAPDVPGARGAPGTFGPCNVATRPCRALAAGWVVLSALLVAGWVTPAVADAGSATPTAAAVSLSLARQGDPGDVALQDREVVSLVLGLAALPLVLLHWRTIMSIPGARWWIAALMVREVAWLFAVLESFFLPDLLNVLEHVLLSTSTALLAVGAWRVLRVPARPVASEA